MSVIAAFLYKRHTCFYHTKANNMQEYYYNIQHVECLNSLVTALTGPVKVTPLDRQSSMTQLLSAPSNAPTLLRYKFGIYLVTSFFLCIWPSVLPFSCLFFWLDDWVASELEVFQCVFPPCFKGACTRTESEQTRRVQRPAPPPRLQPVSWASRTRLHPDWTIFFGIQKKPKSAMLLGYCSLVVLICNPHSIIRSTIRT